MALPNVSNPDSVRRAIAEYDEVERTVFLAKYGFRRAKRYFVVNYGKLHDAPAILAAAHGLEFPDKGPLTPEDFDADGEQAREKLEKLGFKVRAIDMPVRSA